MTRPFQGLDPKSSVTNEPSQGSGSAWLGDPKPRLGLGLGLGLAWAWLGSVSSLKFLAQLGLVSSASSDYRTTILFIETPLHLTRLRALNEPSPCPVSARSLPNTGSACWRHCQKEICFSSTSQKEAHDADTEGCSLQRVIIRPISIQKY